MQEPTAPLRAAVISHACVIAENQRVWAELARHDELAIDLIAPLSWQASVGGETGFSPLPVMAGRAHPLPVRRSGSLATHTYRRLLTTLQEIAPQVIVLEEDPCRLVALQAAMAARRLNARLIVSFTQNIAKKHPWPVSAIERYVGRQAAGALASSQECLQIARSKGYKGPAEIIHYPIDTERFAPIHQPAAAHPVLRVGYAGRLVREKGVEDLVWAMAEVQKHLHAELVIIGDGPLRENIRSLAAKVLRPGSMRLIHGVGHGDMPRQYPGLDLLVLPSRTTRRWKEQFGRTLAEAMACEVPVIGSSSGFIPELIETARGGLVFPEGDHAALAEAIVYLGKNPALRTELGERGRRGVIAHYSVPVLADRIHRFIRQLTA